MASPPLCLIFLSLMVVQYCPLHSTAVRFGRKVDEELVKSICKESQDPDFCNRNLGTDPRVGAAANMDGLALISISLTITQLQSTLDNIPALLGQISTDDPVGKQRLGACQTEYNDAIVQFRGAYGSSNAKAYFDVINWVRDGTNKVIDCENSYKRDPISVSPITTDNYNVIKLSEIIFIIVDKILPH